MLERMMSYPVFKGMEREMTGRHWIELEEKGRQRLVDARDTIGDLRDIEHAIIEEGEDLPTERIERAFGLRDLFALVEEAINHRIESPHPDYEVAAFNTERGVEALIALLESRDEEEL